MNEIKSPKSGAPGTLAQGVVMPAMDPQSAQEFSKHVQAWAKGHAAAAALRDRWGAHFPAPGTTAQSGAPGVASFSPTVADHVRKLTNLGWQHVQGGGGHFLRGPGGKVVRFDPTTGAMTVVNNGQPATLAQGATPGAGAR